MFKRKKKKVTLPKVETTQVTVPTLHGLKDAVVSAGTDVADWADGQAQAASEWARPRIEQGIENSKDAASKAAAKRDEAASKAAAKREEARDRLESKGSKLSGALAGSNVSAKELRSRSQDAALVLKGEAKAKPVKKKSGILGTLLGVLGVLAVAGAVAAYVAKTQQPKDDPWARPLTDPYVAPESGRDSTVGTTGVPATSSLSEVERGGHPTDGLPHDSDVQARDSDATLGDVLKEEERPRD